MNRRARPTSALLAALLALAVQWCLPLAHAAHEAAHVAAAPAHHHHGHHDDDDDGHGHDSQGSHDESQCPTCQQFVLLRSFTSLDAPVTLAAIDATDAGAAPAYDAPPVSHARHSSAVPRGPPGC